ncbi:hypothetical protein RUM44_007730 [Polyplax serrata]|uniref:ethanolamine kinase n=1 Tax=Polyplax serrata TaxID=468196 RepID=A0ABR1BAR2_POLSC
MDVPHLNFSIEEDSAIEGAKRILSHFRPTWDLSRIKFKVFTDGTTNKLVGFFDPQNASDVVLIRVNGNKTDLLIDRKKEAETIKILHAAGLAPALYGTFDNGLVYEYVPGVVLTVDTVRADTTSALVAKKMADMHRVKPENGGTTPEPALWPTINKFLSQVPETFTHPEKRRRFDELFPSKPDLRKEFTFLEKELGSLNSPVVLCHNDLLVRNIIYNSEDESVTFIDYEYADFNYQAYDIANHFNEFAGIEMVDYRLYPNEMLQNRWLRVYLERYSENEGVGGARNVRDDEVEELRQKVEKFTLASHFLWGVWALLQGEYSTIEFDFIEYASIRLNEFLKIKKKLYGH